MALAANGTVMEEKLVHDSDAQFTALIVGTPLRVEVSALNATGESPRLTGTITL